MKRFIFAVLATFTICGNALAIDLYWDNDGVAAGNDATTGAGLGGTGSWSTAVPVRWWDGTSATDVVWAETNSAIFTGTAGTVTLSGARNVNGLTFKTNGYILTGANLTLTGTPNFVASSGVTATINTTLTALSTGGFNVLGGGTIALANSGNNETGAIGVTGGSTLSIASASRIGSQAAGSGNITLNNGTLQNTDTTNIANAFLTANRSILVGAGGGTIDLPSSVAVLSYAGAITGVGNTLTKTGPGELRFTSASPQVFTFQKLVLKGGQYTLGTGTTLGQDTQLGAIPGSTLADAVTLDGGTLRFAGGSSLTNIATDAKRGFTVTANGGTLRVNETTVTINGAFTGSGALTKTGSLTLTLTADSSSSFSGPFTLSAGTLALASDGAIGTGQFTIASGTTVIASGAPRTLSNNVVLGGNATIGSGNNMTFNGTFTNGPTTTSVLSSAQAGTITFGNSVYLSDSLVTGKSLTLAGSGSSNPQFTITGNVANANGSGLAGNIQVGNGSAATAAKLTLSGTNTHSGATTVSTGSLLNIASAGALGSSTLTTGGNGSFDNTTGAALTLSNNIALSGGSPTFVGTNDLSFGNNTVAMSGASGRTITTTAGKLTVGKITEGQANMNFTKSGAGTLELLGNSTYGGATTVSNGKLLVNGSIGGTGVTVNTGGKLGGNGSTNTTVALAGGTLSPGNSIGAINSGALTLTTGTYDFEFSYGGGTVADNAVSQGADLWDVNGQLAIANVVTLVGTDLGTVPFAPLIKFTVFSYLTAGSPAATNFRFANAPTDDGYVLLDGVWFKINYDDTTVGVNGGISGRSYVTLTTVPEASSVLVMGLAGMFAIGAVWMGRRYGLIKA